MVTQQRPNNITKSLFWGQFYQHKDINLEMFLTSASSSGLSSSPPSPSPPPSPVPAHSKDPATPLLPANWKYKHQLLDTTDCLSNSFIEDSGHLW